MNDTERQRFEAWEKGPAEEWHKAGKPGRQGDYVTRYATAQAVSGTETKEEQRKSYAGFQNLVHLS